MSNDFFEQLAQTTVPPPPPPAEFDRQLHERVNRSLLMVQLAELVTGAIPWALAHLGRALMGWVVFTFSGKFDSSRKKK